MRRATVLAIAVLVVVPGAAHAAPVTLAKVGDFAMPVYVTAPLGDTQRVFVVEKGGTIQVVNAAGARSTFLDLTSKVLSTDSERGLLSTAFSLDYATSGLFYVYYTARDPVGQLTIEEHRVDPANPDRADPSYARPLVTIPHNLQGNHNGGQLQFGPDGLLYVGTGDGGSGGDPSGNAQDTAPAPPSTVGSVNHDYRLGKLLRIDPATGAVTIFAYGLRNPWRFSYDRNTGDLIIGDVGQDRYEEVDFAAAPGNGAGANYGWNTYEGLHTYPGNAPAGAASGTVLPVIEYPHGPACSITGGYVVRDPALPELAGTYLYGDNCTGEIAAATLPGGTPRTLGFNVANVSSFGEDGCGRVYAASLGGSVYRFASSGACAGPAPFVGRLPAGVSPAPPVAGPDRRAPAFTLLRAAARQRALRTGYVAIGVRCDELCSVRAGGRVLITRRARASAAKTLRTRTARATLAAGAKTTLRLRIAKSTRRSIKRALARHRVATVRISVRAADKAGNARSRVRRVQIVR